LNGAPRARYDPGVYPKRARRVSGAGSSSGASPPELPMKSTRLVFAAVVLALSATLHAQTPPAGFADEVVWSGLSVPTGMAFLPDGRLICCEQFSAAMKIRSTTGSVGTMGTVPGVSTGSERGLLSICADPLFPTRPYIYTWYSRTSPQNMVLSMWTASGAGLSDPTSSAVTLANQYVIIGDAPDSAFNHNGGTIRFGPDGYLYLSIGDDASSCQAQNLDVLQGCMLRLDVSTLPGAGVGPPAKSVLIPPGGNPWNTGSDNRKLHFAIGLRNPFRFHIDAPTGEFFIADVGQNTWEEISLGVPAGGENFGWPWYEGNVVYGAGAGCNGGVGSTVVNFPIATLNPPGSASIISLGRYRTTGGLFDFGPAYDGDYFYVDYYEGTVRRLDWTGAAFSAPVTWGTAGSFGGITDAALGSDGALYYCKAGSNQIRRIKSTANLPTCSIVSGNNQAANAGWAFFNPLKVQITQGGSPMANVAVTFAATSGNVSFPPQPIMTDANGFAEVTPTLLTTPPTNPVVTASGGGSNVVTFNATWRGLTTTYLPSVNLITSTVRHSAPFTPISMIVDAPTASPFATFPFGDVWTSIFSPLPTTFGFDWLGPPYPPAATNASNTYTLTLTNLPILGNLPLRIQAYAFDGAKTGFEVFMISNKIDVVLN
jgi:glucose/arabinose dehydrogenase